jgi:hypothetical protein
MVAWVALTLAAAEDPGEKGFGPGLPGFLVVFFLAVAVYLLFRSMTHHLRKVRYSPDPAAAEADGTTGSAGTDGTAGSAGTDGPDGTDGTDEAIGTADSAD